MKNKLIIWDVDGTLIDSRHMIQSAMATAFSAQGLTPPDYAQTRTIVGLSLKVAIDRLAPRDIGPDGLDALVEAYKDAFVALRQNKDDNEPLYPGMEDVLLAGQDAGWVQGIATGKSRRGLDAILDRHRWRDLFACHFCADDGPGKPDPHMVRENLRVTGIAPNRAVMIGDTSYDMRMAKLAGVTAIGVDWGFHNRSEIELGGADAIVSTAAELRQMLNNFAQRIAV